MGRRKGRQAGRQAGILWWMMELWMFALPWAKKDHEWREKNLAEALPAHVALQCSRKRCENSELQYLKQGVKTVIAVE